MVLGEMNARIGIEAAFSPIIGKYGLYQTSPGRFCFLHKRSEMPVPNSTGERNEVHLELTESEHHGDAVRKVVAGSTGEKHRISVSRN